MSLVVLPADYWKRISLDSIQLCNEFINNGKYNTCGIYSSRGDVLKGFRNTFVLFCLPQ